MPVLTARQVMTPFPCSVTPDLSVRELAAMFAEKNISGAPVVSKVDGTLVGVVSRTDLFRRISERSGQDAAYLFDLLNNAPGRPANTPSTEPLIVVADFMADNPVTVTPDDPVSAVARAMSTNRIHRVVVIDPARKPIGIITTLDVLRAFPE